MMIKSVFVLNYCLSNAQVDRKTGEYSILLGNSESSLQVVRESLYDGGFFSID